MKPFSSITALLLFLSPFTVQAQKFLDTEPAESLFDLGARVGMNTSVHTFPSGFFDKWNHNSWGTGFDAGVVCDLNLRNYISIQPGFFFESRSGNYSYIQEYGFPGEENEQLLQVGHYRAYYFQIPVMVSVKMNLSENVKWIAEAGPYIQLKLHASDNENIEALLPAAGNGDYLYTLEKASAKSTDFGLKIGTGILVNNHYSFNIHYLAGGCDVWKAPFNGGKNKAWVFTVGYNL